MTLSHSVSPQGNQRDPLQPFLLSVYRPQSWERALERADDLPSIQDTENHR